MAALWRSAVRLQRPLLTAGRPFSALARASEDYWRDRVHLAACYRILDKLGINEGICNHLTLMSRLPGGSEKGRDVMLVNPYGLAWSEVTASCLLAVDADGKVVDGEGELLDTALTIHQGVHEARPDAKAVFHTHMPYATALACLAEPRLEPCHQNATRFSDEVAVDYAYNGLSEDMEEGRRIGAQLGDKAVMLMQAHGVLVTGPSAAVAFDRLYYFERAARSMVLSLWTGRELARLDEETIAKSKEGILRCEEHFADRHFETWLRLLRKEGADFDT